MASAEFSNRVYTWLRISMRSITIVSLTILLFLVPTFRAIETLPAQLSDSEFWGLIADSSEDGGTFLSENFLSNERGFQYVIPPLLQEIQSGGVYMGVGPEQNFTYVAAFHPKIAFVVDIRRQNMIEHLLYKAVFEMSPNRAEFMSRLFSRKAPAELNAGSSVDELFSAFAAVPLDPEYHQRNLDSVKDLLWKEHKFGLTTEDEASLEHVYDAIVKAGTTLGYSVSDPNLAGRVITTRIFDSTTGISDVTVLTPTDLTSQYRILRIPGSPNDPEVLVSPPKYTVTTFPTYSDLMTATDGNGVKRSYLTSESNYRTVRELQQKNLIVPLVGDFAGPKAIQAVGKYLSNHNATVSVFYLSNVEQYLAPTEKLKRFYENVATLPLNESSSFIRSAQATGVQPGIVQSYSSPVRDVLDAVIEDRAQTFNDILRLSH